ncbi:hypothetical protein [Nocardioides aquiterrae]|uniref:DUF559 domain-containing protein n=1 Tax=Nocardioides aquiterrae TaxID=203799 RepID=A0ABP4ETT0_9ACTN
MFDDRQPFTRADGLGAGIPRNVLDGPKYSRIFRNVHISSAVRIEQEQRFSGALLLHPEGAFLSHTSGARVRRIAVPDDPFVHVSVTDAKDRRWSPGLKPHVAPPHTEVVVVDGTPVSGLVRNFIELAAILPLVDVVVAGDDMCRRLNIRAAWLRAQLAKSKDYWSPAARYAASYVRNGVGSPMESRLRMLLVLAGFPEPEVNVEIRDENGDVLLQFDLGYRRAKVAIGYDGRRHVEVVDDWEHDITRRDRTDDAAWREVTVVASGVYVDPLSTLDRVARALTSRGVEVPRIYDPEWMRHFPGRRRAA